VSPRRHLFRALRLNPAGSARRRGPITPRRPPRRCWPAGRTGSTNSTGPGFTLAEPAAEIGRAADWEVAYTDLSPEKYAEFLVGVGVPQTAAAVIADGDRGAAHGALEVTGNDLETLLGRPATPVADVIRAALG